MSNLNKARFMKGEEITTKKSNEEILDKIRKEEFGDEYEEIQEEIIPAEEHKDEESPVYETHVEENYDEDDNDDEGSQDEQEDVEEEPEYKPAPKKKVYNRKPQKQETKVEPQSENPLYKKLLLKLKLELIEEARNTIEIDGFSESEIDMVWESILEDIQK